MSKTSAGGGQRGTSLGGRVEVNPRLAARRARRRREQDRSWAKKASDVEVRYVCVCAKNPQACRLHPLGPDRE